MHFLWKHHYLSEPSDVQFAASKHWLIQNILYGKCYILEHLLDFKQNVTEL